MIKQSEEMLIEDIDANHELLIYMLICQTGTLSENGPVGLDYKLDKDKSFKPSFDSFGLEPFSALVDGPIAIRSLFCQFQVTQSNRLNCIMYQRSCDMGLGVPFNIASYSLLTCLIARVTGLERGQFVHMMGDMHVYKDHIEQLRGVEEIKPYPFPVISFVIADFFCSVLDFKKS